MRKKGILFLLVLSLLSFCCPVQSRADAASEAAGDGRLAENYADDLAWEHAQDHGGGEYLEWLADYCVHVAGPQAVEMLLRIPCFREAADEGLLSKYIVLHLTYNDVNQFGAMTTATFLEKGGNITHGAGAPIYNIAYSLLINTFQQDEGLRDSPEKIRELQDTLVHEMMHAFMYDYTRNAMVGTDRNGYRAANFSEALPDWFCEGTAISAAAGYNQSRSGILQNFFLSEDSSQNEILELFGDAERMTEAQTRLFDAFTEEDWEYIEQQYGTRDILLTDLTLEENTYITSYAGVMFLYSMAAGRLGLEPVDENGSLNMNALLMGLDYILRCLHSGYSLDQVIQEISTNEATGLPVYSDTAEFEKNFMHGADEPGMVFTRKMLYDLESQITDHNEYMPSGSVLPGYRTMSTDFMDNQVHPAPEVFALVTSPQADRSDDLFAVSTVRPSELALGGTRSISYVDEPALSPAEAAEKDTIYAGDRVCLIDFNTGQDYTGMNDWMILSEQMR
ncbi:MAG: hypothetical protein J6U01_10950 [Clostridia bacterium]|nr:hypothetical protein [Clostridia bacterium]